MHPYLRDGDILELNAANPELKKGDIVVFSQNGSLFAHRIVNVNSTEIETRGDAVFSQEKLNRTNIIGKVIARIRDDKYTNLEGFTATCYASLLPFSQSWLRIWNFVFSKKRGES